VELATDLVKYPWSVTLLVGVLAGWLMGLMTLLVTAGQNTISQAAFVWIIAVAIGLSHLPHSIAGSIFVGLLKYGHGVRAGTTKEDIEVSMDGEEKEQRM
jgi:formate/nitrite transporter FocA (FNT family)